MKQLIQSIRKKFQRGFTLVELVIVIAVIAVLAAVLIPTFITVIDNANNSADIQLVKNMNTALAASLNDGSHATAESLHKLMKDNGIDDLSTKKKENVILYNKENNQFELVNLDNVTIKAKTEVAGASLVAQTVSESSTLEVDLQAYSPEEIFDGFILTSTGGNDLSAGIHALHNWAEKPVDGSTVLKYICSYNEKDADPTINAALRVIISRTLYVAKNGDAFTLILDGDGIITGTSIATKDTTMAVFHEEADTLYLAKLARGINSTASNVSKLCVIIPNTIQTCVEGTDADWKQPDNLLSYSFGSTYFFGNTKPILQLQSTHITDEFNIQGSEQFDLMWSISQNGKSIEEYVRECWNAGLDVKPLIYLSETTTWLLSDGKVCTTMEDAVTWALRYTQEVGAAATIILANKTYEIKSNITIPENVTLKIPYEKKDSEFLTGRNFITENSEGELHAGNADSYTDVRGNQHSITHFDNYNSGSNAYIPGTVADDDLKTTTGYAYQNQTFKQYELRINEGATLTVNGTLEVGGILSYVRGSDNTPYYMGCVAGNYGQITNEGTITIANGGAMEVNGYVKGTGNVNVLKGGTVLEPLVITDFTGGSNMLALFNSNTFPFSRYALPNVSKMTVNYGAILKVVAGVRQTGGASIKVTGITDTFVGYGADEKNSGLITLDREGASICIEYGQLDHAVADKTNTKNNLAGDIGINKITLDGEISAKSLKIMSLAGLFGGDGVKDIAFPIPYNFEYEINGTFHIYNKYIALPGARITVNEGGILDVTANSEFYIADCLEQNQITYSKKYPTSTQLKEATLPTSAVLTLNGGTLEIGDNAEGGGIIQIGENGGTVKISNSVDTTGKFSFGGHGSNTYNTVRYNSPLRVYTSASNSTNLVAGKTYQLQSAGTETVEVQCAYIYNENNGLYDTDRKLTAKVADAPDGDFENFGCDTVSDWEWYLHSEKITVATCTVTETE